jgi:hypothetical protein
MERGLSSKWVSSVLVALLFFRCRCRYGVPHANKKRDEDAETRGHQKDVASAPGHPIPELPLRQFGRTQDKKR